MKATFYFYGTITDEKLFEEDLTASLILYGFSVSEYKTINKSSIEMTLLHDDFDRIMPSLVNIFESLGIETEASLEGLFEIPFEFTIL